MGGKGSGAQPGQNSNHRGGMPKKAAVAVVGSGVPILPENFTDEEFSNWEFIVELTGGVACSQDSLALCELAQLMELQVELRQERRDGNKDPEIVRLIHANGRAMQWIWTQFGLTPRSRQVLLVPKEEEELDEFEQMMKGRG